MQEKETRMNAQLQKIYDLLTGVAIDVGVMKGSVEANRKDLEDHMEQTRLLRTQLELQKKELDTRGKVWDDGIREALVPTRWVKTTFKVLSAVGVIVAIITLFI
jgi:uncharacterized protein (UPF0335 family)